MARATTKMMSARFDLDRRLWLPFWQQVVFSGIAILAAGLVLAIVGEAFSLALTGTYLFEPIGDCR